MRSIRSPKKDDAVLYLVGLLFLLIAVMLGWDVNRRLSQQENRHDATPEAIEEFDEAMGRIEERDEREGR